MKLMQMCLSACLFILFFGIADCQADSERIILNESFNWLTKEDADKTISRIKAAGFNVFVPCVWHGRGVSWQSKLAPKEPKWADTDVKTALPDPLAYLIQKAHAEGIQVRPWFTVSLRQRAFLTSFYNAGTPEDSFDVHNAAFRTFMVGLIEEVAKNYDVDGITLDYIRSHGVCLSQSCIDEFRKVTGGDLRIDYAQYAQIDSPGWTRIAQWNAIPIDDLANRIHDTVKKIKPSLPVEACSHAGMRYLLGEGTNSIKWLNAGILDLILHMDYAQLSKLDTNLLNSAIARVDDKNKLILMVGNYDNFPLDRAHPYARDPIEVIKLLKYSQSLNPNSKSVALYEYEFLTDDQIKLINPLLDSPPSAPAVQAIPNRG